MTANDPSPALYRLRGAVFGAIYLVGFWGGWVLCSLNGLAREPFFSWLGRALGPSGSEIVLATATVCVCICWALRVWGSSYLSDGVVWNLDAQTNALIVDGPFQFVRNPLYLGNIFLALGIGSLATPCGFGIIVAGTIIFVVMLIGVENAALLATYGATFESYSSSVPSLFPRLTPARVPGSTKARPSFAQGLRSEIMTGFLAIGMFLVLTGGVAMLNILIGLWLIGWITQAIATRPRAA